MTEADIELLVGLDAATDVMRYLGDRRPRDAAVARDEVLPRILAADPRYPGWLAHTRDGAGLERVPTAPRHSLISGKATQLVMRVS